MGHHESIYGLSELIGSKMHSGHYTLTRIEGNLVSLTGLNNATNGTLDEILLVLQDHHIDPYHSWTSDATHKERLI